MIVRTLSPHPGQVVRDWDGNQFDVGDIICFPYAVHHYLHSACIFLGWSRSHERWIVLVDGRLDGIISIGTCKLVARMEDI
jgi:hypothetical protein